MPFKTTYESDFYKIEVDQENDLLRAEWLRSVNREEMITGGTKLYESLRDYSITKAIANAQRLEAFDTATKEWMSNNFYTLLSQTPLQKLARILPESLFPKLTLEAVATRADAQNINKFIYKNFLNEQEALDWINE
ncbi:hypothetical protein [Pontibacter vulgaris]|uniref:hypothetical protein n=1 Tax=Pontibacter vulgaris TaxID=2905679 RepID=UPI001FA7690D|nr:hypothetical protein [Pontibacter vulgaris]